MFSLPVELQRYCVQYLDVETLKSLRLVTKSALTLATEALFYSVKVFHDEESASSFTTILENSRLSPLVRKVVFDTSGSGDDALDGNEEKDLNEDFRVAMRCVGKFENLCEVELKFGDEVACEDTGPYGWDKEVQETTDFRTRVLKKLFKALNHPEHPAAKVDNLSIKNLQDHTIIYDNENFKTVRSRLRKLALSIATESDEGSPENSINAAPLHQMFNHDLLTYWLKPLQPQLTHLSIYCDTYWGMWPVCDLRTVHFPALKSLSLGNFSIVHDWQIEWILSHGATIEELLLDDCPIVICLKVLHEQCIPNFPNLIDPSRVIGEHEYVTYVKDVPLRWHAIFSRFQSQLPHLKNFALGQGDWDEGKCFEERYEMLPMLLMGRYCVFDCGIGPSQWVEFGRRRSTDRSYKCYHESWGRNEILMPDCDEEDMKALEELVDVVQIRGRS